MVTGIEHVAVTVSSIEKSIPFYKDILGLSVLSEHELEGKEIEQMSDMPGTRLKSVRLGIPNSDMIIDLQEYYHPIGTPIVSRTCDPCNSHFCFFVDDMDQSYVEMKSKGVRFKSEPVVFDLGPEGIVKVVWFYDPDDFVLELLEVKSATG